VTIYKYLEKMDSYISKADWGGLEKAYEQVAKKSVTEKQVQKILEINLSDYQNKLSKGLVSAVRKAKRTEAKAIYFEYDLDNDWASNFFICPDYKTPDAEDDDWASDWIDEVKGPDCVAFGTLYDTSFDRTAFARGNNLLLITRTVATLGRCSESLRL
jgi:hypothetical protein